MSIIEEIEHHASLYASNRGAELPEFAYMSLEKYKQLLGSFRVHHSYTHQRITIVTSAGELEVKPVIGSHPDFVGVGKNCIYDILIKLKVIK